MTNSDQKQKSSVVIDIKSFEGGTLLHSRHTITDPSDVSGLVALIRQTNEMNGWAHRGITEILENGGVTELHVGSFQNGEKL